MLEKLRQLTFKQKMSLLLIFILILIIYNFILVISRVGEERVRITVVPKDAQVSLNGQPEKKRTLYLKSGDYTFSAHKDGFKEDVQKISIKGKSIEVNLIPSPDSQAAFDFLKDNPEIQQQREAIGAIRAKEKGEKLEAVNPIIALLPYSQQTPPFTIDFGASKDRENDTFLVISDSSPNGRTEALRWIRQQGVDPTDLEIIFSDYVNPLAQKEEHAH